MKVLLIGDPHLKASALKQVEIFLDWLQSLIISTQPDIIVNLGDTFHTHNVVRSEVMSFVDRHIRWLVTHYNGTAYILVGNHDMAHHTNSEVHAWIPYKAMYEGVVIVDRPMSVNGKFSLLPYIDDVSSFDTHLQAAMLSTPLIFCHQTFKNANLGFTLTKEGAVVPENYSGQIISGHIHTAQDLGCVWYPGTAYAQEAADHDQVKGIYVYNSETRGRTFFRSPLPQWMTYRSTPANVEAVIRLMNKDDKNHLVIEGPGTEVNAVVDSRLFKALKQEYGFTVKKSATHAIKSSNSLKKVHSMESAVVEYIDKIYDGSVDREKLKEKCLLSLK